MEKEEIYKILSNLKLMSVGTYGDKYPDNSIVCFAYDEQLNFYFGSYSDTLKCKNIERHPVVAITIGTLQIHGEAAVVPYGTEEYSMGRKIYDARFPQYTEVFERETNELYKIKPYVIWNYNPSVGEMHRDELVLNQEYYGGLEVYKPHTYRNRI